MKIPWSLKLIVPVRTKLKETDHDYDYIKHYIT